MQQEAFNGPLGLLLELLDKKELEIKDVALACIADEYLDHVEKAKVPTDELADFLVVASRLIYLKSRELMPYLRIKEEDENVANLEDQLRLYRLFVEAANKLEDRFGTAVLYERPFSRTRVEQKPAFHPAENITPLSLQTAFEGLLKRLEPFFVLQQVSMERVKSVEERLDELVGAIKTRAKMTFKDVTSGAKKKVDVVVSFLALLELARRQLVKISQNDQEIMIERV